jgi:putative membrane protein
MKKLFLLTITIFILGLASPTTSFAQGMIGFPNLSIDNATIQSQQQEEQEGKKFLDDLNNKTIVCSQLNDSDFEKIGEYFMGQSIGDTSRHIAMNEMMKRMLGEKGEEQAHSAMGKRLSGCDTSAALPTENAGFWPMMNMMGGWSSSSKLNQTNNNPMMWNFGNNPMGWGFGFGWIFMLIFWVLIIAGIIALIKWFMAQSHGSHGNEKSPLEILKERYAKGEIDKKEFEERKKDLS